MSWQLTSFLILGGALALGFAWYERSRPPARVLALVAALAALAVVGRIALAPFPNVKPTTDIVLFAGYALGGAPGFAVGAVTALVSNIFFSHGPWTPWQMAAWGGVGMAGGALGAVVRGRGWSRARGADRAPSAEPRELGRWGLALACGLAGLGFGIVMDLYLWTLGAEQTLASYLALSARSLPFNVAHIVGNVVFCLLIGPPLVRALRRYRRRFEVRWVAPAGAGAAGRGGASTAALALAFAVVLAGGAIAPAPAAEAASATDRAARYLAGSQNRDGGFAAGREGSSSQFYTREAAFGLAAAGRNPRDVAQGENSIIDYAKENIDSVRDTGGIERTILLARAAGLSPRRFAGRKLYAELLEARRRRSDGSFDGNVPLTAFGVLALRAAGESSSTARVQGSAGWLADRQHEDGGFGLGSESDVDITGAVLQALAVAGDANGESGRLAVGYLNEAQGDEGGFGQTAAKKRSPNSQSTAYAVQGLVAAGDGDGTTARAALSFIRSLRNGDGSIRFSKSSSQTPVWVTGQALAALRKKPFPLKPVPRRPAPPRPAPREEPKKDTGRAKGATGADDSNASGRPSRPSNRRSRRRRAEGSGSGVGAGTGAGSGQGLGSGTSPDPTGAGGATGPAFPIGSTAVPTAASPFSVPGLSGAIGAVGGLATPTPALPNPLSAKPPKRPQPPSPSADRGRPRTPVAANKPLGARGDKPGPKVGAGAGALLLVLVAAGLLLATGGGARARRLWAAARRRTT